MKKPFVLMFAVAGLATSLILTGSGCAMGGGGNCSGNCTLTGTWSAYEQVSCASSVPSCAVGVVDAKGNLPTIQLPTNYGVLSNATSGEGAGIAAVVTISVTNVEAGSVVSVISNSCPKLYSDSGSVVFFQLTQVNPPQTCSITLGSNNSAGQATGQSVSIAYSGPD